MNFEVLKRSHLKRNIIIGVVAVAIISAVILNFTRAKYIYTDKMPLINGTVNYSLADLNIVAIYVGGEAVDSLDSSKQYTLDTTQSTCTYKDGSTIEGLSISYETETGMLTITPFTTKGTKCVLYFDEQVSAADTILAGKTEGNRGSLGSAFSTNTTGEYFTTTDWDGTTYYFAGNPSDNWVSFAGFYWRIIRINGDGSIRLIYQGTSANTTGSGTQIGTSAFNSSYSESRYVGLVYGSTTEQYGYGNNSTIMKELNEWYQRNLASRASYIDTGAGFCSDRGPDSGWSNTGSFNYAPSTRIRRGSPSLDCGDADILSVDNGRLTYPIGLITADEVMYGGIPNWNSSNNSNYLYTGEYYWTMSPSSFNGYNANVFLVESTGYLTGSNVDWTGPGVRPVINLKAYTLFEAGGTGTSTNPYVVV